MLKTVLAGAAALAIAGSSLVYAQQGPAPSQGPAAQAPAGAERAARPRWQPTPEDRSALIDARVAALKAGLKLTPEQEKNWPAFEQAFRDFAKARAERRAERRTEQHPADPVARLERRADAIARFGTDLKHLAEAAGPLYRSLDEGQKHRFVIMARAMRPHHPRFALWRAHRGPGAPGGAD